ncbi:MAG: hypothetical protein J0H08_17160 [Rhizobiales bacterium]|nr:hypothetical protein [Hyphomicrobiales bacterium]
MLKYIYIVAKKDKAPLRRALDRFLSELPFWPTGILVRKEDRSLLIAAEIAEAAAPGQRNLHIDRDGAFTAYEGLPLGAHLRARPDAWPSEIGARVRADRSRFFAETAGVFGVAYGTVGEGMVAFADFTGGAPIYYADRPDFVAVSNRAGMIGRAVMDAAPDLEGLSFLTGQANMFVPFSSYRDVQSLRPGWCVSIDRGGALKLLELPRFWTSAFEKRPLVQADFDQLTDRLGAPLSHLADAPFRDLTLSLTGGRDSRLCLALALAAGLEPTCWTGGAASSPEIECARAVAAVAGVRYRAETFDPGAFDFASYWERLKSNTFRYEGMLCLYDGNLGSARQRRSQTEIKGFGGEILSINVKAHKDLRLESRAEAVARLRDYQQPMDPLAIQQPAVTRWQRRFIARHIKSKIDAGAALEDLTDLLYVENRMSLWSAILGQRLGNLPLQPLCNFQAAQIAFSGEASHRRVWRSHFEALRRLSPPLASHPFLGTTWDPALAPGLGGAIAAPFVTSTPLTLASIAPSQVLALRHGWRTISAFLLDHPSSGLFDIVDRRSLIETLAAGPESLDGHGVKELHALVGMQMFLSGMGQRKLEGYSGEPPSIDSNIGTLRLCRDGDDWWISRKGHRGLVVSAQTGVPAELLDDGRPRSLAATFAGGPAKSVRIDPLDRPGRAAIGEILVRAGRYRVAIPAREARLKGPRILAERGDFILIEAEGDDPQIHVALSLPAKAKGPIVLKAAIVPCLSTCTIEFFIDRGRGYTRDGMRRIVVEDPEPPAGSAFEAVLGRLFPDHVLPPEPVVPSPS